MSRVPRPTEPWRPLRATRAALPLLGALLVLAAACGDDEAREIDCDVRERACQERVFRDVAELFARPALDGVPIDTLSPDDWVTDLRAAAWPTGNVADAINADALFQIGFLRERVESFDSAWIESQGNQVLAFYDGGVRRISLLVPDDAGPPDGRDATQVLAHEATHAYQDDAFRTHALLTALYAAGDDRQATLVHATLEGQALVVQSLLEAKRLGAPPSRMAWDEWVLALFRDLLAAANDATSPFLSVRTHIRYVAGAAMAVDAFVAAGYDLAATDALIRRPPENMADVLRSLPGRVPVAVPRRAEPLTLPLPPRSPDPLVDSALLEALDVSFYGSWALDAWDFALLVAPSAGAGWSIGLAEDCDDVSMEVFLTRDGEVVSLLWSHWRTPQAATEAHALLKGMHGEARWKRDDARSAGDVGYAVKDDRDVVLAVSPDADLSSALVYAAVLRR